MVSLLDHDGLVDVDLVAGLAKHAFRSLMLVLLREVVQVLDLALCRKAESVSSEFQAN